MKLKFLSYLDRWQTRFLRFFGHPNRVWKCICHFEEHLYHWKLEFQTYIFLRNKKGKTKIKLSRLTTYIETKEYITRKKFWQIVHLFFSFFLFIILMKYVGASRHMLFEKKKHWSGQLVWIEYQLTGSATLPFYRNLAGLFGQLTQFANNNSLTDVPYVRSNWPYYYYYKSYGMQFPSDLLNVYKQVKMRSLP